MGLMPTSFFFRMAYSESMFVLAEILFLFAMARRAPLLLVSLAIGVTTAIRPVGVCNLLPLAWHVYTRSTSPVAALRRFLLLLPISCWGILAFMAFQYRQFDQPFAFFHTQADWRIRPRGYSGDKGWALLSWEPVWNVYVPGSPGYWRELGETGWPLFNLQFANPIYFIGTAGLIGIGCWKRWLTVEEVLASVPLLLVPYVSRSFEMCMASQGRFAAAVVPVYPVLGQMLARLPVALAVTLLAGAAALMTAYGALFAAGYPLI